MLSLYYVPPQKERETQDKTDTKPWKDTSTELPNDFVDVFILML